MANRRRRSEHGAVTVEFVFVLPFLLGIIFLIISLGVMLSFRQTMSQAAAEGARAAAVAPSNLSYDARKAKAREAIGTAFQGQIGGAVACGTGLTCSFDPPAGAPPCNAANKCVTVTVTYGYRADPRVQVPLVPDIMLPETLTYTASARIN